MYSEHQHTKLYMNPCNLCYVLEAVKSMELEEADIEIQLKIEVDEVESSHNDIQITQENDVADNIVDQSALVKPEDF